MANICLDSFLNEEKKGLANFDWLDINPAEYDNTPFHDLPPYMAIPKLEEAWSHTNDSQNFNLVPNMDTDFNTRGPQQKDDSSDIKILLDYVKKQMMSGKTGKDLVELVSKKATPDLIKQAYPELQKLSKEQGLLGNVYVDPTIFVRCVDGAEFTGKVAKTAKYVVAMDKCAGCSHNRNQRCEVYKKKIASEVSYGQETLDFYSKHFSNVNGKNIVVSSKSELQEMFTFKPIASVKVAESKPSVEEVDEKTLEEKEKVFNKHMKSLKDSLNNMTEIKAGREVSELLVKGYDSRTIASHFKNKYSSQEFENSKEVINQVLAKQGSLGSVYVEAAFLPIDDSQDEKNIMDYMKGVPVKFIIIKPEAQNFNKLKNVCPKLNKTVVPNLKMIPKMSWETEFNKYPEEIREKIASIFEENPVKGLRLAFIQKNMIKKSAVEVEEYNLKSALDNTEYSPENKVSVSLTPGKVKAALEKGYTFSSIIHTGRQLGVSDKDIASSIKKAFETVKEIHKYQANVASFKVPASVKIVMSQKDVNADLGRSLENLPDFAFNSFDAPVDSCVQDLGLRTSELNMSDVKKTSSADLDVEIEATSLGEYNVG